MVSEEYPMSFSRLGKRFHIHVWFGAHLPERLQSYFVDGGVTCIDDDTRVSLRRFITSNGARFCAIIRGRLTGARAALVLSDCSSAPSQRNNASSNPRIRFLHVIL